MEALDSVLKLLEESFISPTSRSQGCLHFESGQNKGRCLQIDDGDLLNKRTMIDNDFQKSKYV